MGWETCCSMPHGKSIIYPFLLGTISTVLSFRTLSSCDLISTKSSIDCSSQYSSQCVFKSTLGLGLLGKETYIDLQIGGSAESKIENLTKVCKFYSEEEREWLLDGLWQGIAVSQGAIVMMGVFGLVCVGITSCFLFRRRQIFKTISAVFSLCAFMNCLPLMLQFTSNFCQLEEGTCNETGSSCLSSCRWGSGSWQTLATSFLWLSSSITTWLISPPPVRTFKECSLEINTSDSSEKDQIDLAKSSKKDTDTNFYTV
mmetsp:Transcript_22591/g.28510  ORF Transcript_22591/g.28510 Transcript_22591/m.28510 type:complete len:257 (-) Transcript_22591:88-858(-)